MDSNCEITVYPMCEEHISDIAELERICFRHPWTAENLRAELKNPTARFFAAKSGNKLIGYIGANNICGEVYIADIAVFPEYRRRGAAAALMDKLILESKNENALFISLEVRKSNSAAAELYNKFGFCLQGVRPDFYTEPDEDALIMTKYLKNGENNENTCN